MPPANVQTSSETSEDYPDGPAVERTEAILVVEDEQLLRNLVARILRAAGYVVFTAACGEEALAVFKAHAVEVNLLFCDVIVPDVTGCEVLRHIHETHPGLPAVLCSGDPDAGRLADCLMNNRFALIAKPFRRMELLRAIRTALDATVIR